MILKVCALECAFLRRTAYGLAIVVTCCLLTDDSISQEGAREVPLPIARLTDIPLVDIHVRDTKGELTDSQVEDAIASLDRIRHTSAIPGGVHSYSTKNRLSFPSMIRSESTIDSAIRKLVRAGPSSIALLLSHLDDSTPTELVLDSESPTKAAAADTRLWFERVYYGNPVNSLEQAAFGLRLTTTGPSMSEPRSDVVAYRIKVGDVCYMILGQVVGRSFEFPHSYIKSFGGAISSPVQDAALARKIRRMWRTTNYDRRLLEWLLIDFSTRGVDDGQSLDHWGYGSHFQLVALPRLLYYYPRESAPLIVRRLDELDLSLADDVSTQAIRNGVRADDFIDAVCESAIPEVRSPLERAAKRASDPSVIEVLKKHRFKVSTGR